MAVLGRFGRLLSSDIGGIRGCSRVAGRSHDWRVTGVCYRCRVCSINAVGGMVAETRGNLPSRRETEKAQAKRIGRTIMTRAYGKCRAQEECVYVLNCNFGRKVEEMTKVIQSAIQWRGRKSDVLELLRKVHPAKQSVEDGSDASV